MAIDPKVLELVLTKAGTLAEARDFLREAGLVGGEAPLLLQAPAATKPAAAPRRPYTREVEQHPQAGKKWSAADDQQLLVAFNTLHTEERIYTIAEQMGRSVVSIGQRMRDLGHGKSLNISDKARIQAATITKQAARRALSR